MKPVLAKLISFSASFCVHSIDHQLKPRNDFVDTVAVHIIAVAPEHRDELLLLCKGLFRSSFADHSGREGGVRVLCQWYRNLQHEEKATKIFCLDSFTLRDSFIDLSGLPKHHRRASTYNSDILKTRE